MFASNRSFTPSFTYRCTFTPYVSFDTARVGVHASTTSPSRLASIALGFRISDAKYYSLDLAVAQSDRRRVFGRRIAQPAHQRDLLVPAESMRTARRAD